MPRSISEIKSDLFSSEHQISEYTKKCNKLHAEIMGYRDALLARDTMALNALAKQFEDTCSKKGNPHAFGWTHPNWEGFQPDDNQELASLRIGGLIEPLFPDEAKIDLPLEVPLFSGSSAILILHDKHSQKAARNTLQSLLLRTALLMASQVRLTLLDPAGMGAAYPFRGFLGREIVRNTGRSPAEELSEVLDDIRRINERVIGDAQRFSGLTTEQRSGESFEIIAAADFPKAYSKDPRAVEFLVRIANAGPRAGRHLVLEWNMDEQLPHDFDQSQLKDAVTIDLRSAKFRIDELPDGTSQKTLVETAFAGAKRREGGDWNSVVRPKKTDSPKSAAVRVETPIGERLRFWLGEGDDGKQSAHAMIAGQVGSGKSYLLHVLISGLAARYSPEEIRFTLIDGKQGVEFEAYRNLPHADVVCLRTAPALARSVLADFVSEMDHRYEMFQNEGVVKLADYREKTGTILSRRLLVIDEYQQILDGDPESGAALLGRLLEKGRAAGMHAVLGSQTFEQRGLPSSALSHIHTWGALSLAESYSQSIQVFGSEGKRLIRDLAATGEIVLNDEGGRDGANSRGAVARLRTKDGTNLLPEIIREISAATGSPLRPVVLSGREGALVTDNNYLTQTRKAAPTPSELQTIARTPVRDGGFGMESWNQADRPVPIWLGRRFDVRGHAMCALRRAPGQNLLILGNQSEARTRMLAMGIAALGTLLPPSSMEVILVDGLRKDMPGGEMMVAGVLHLTTGGFKVRHATEEDLPAILDELVQAAKSPDPSSPSRLLIITEPDYLYSLHSADRFSAAQEGVPAALRQLLARGPQAGIHTILSASALSSFQLVLSPSREAQLFNHRVVQQMNEDESMTLFSSLTAARLSEKADHPFASLLIDQLAGTRNAVLFHSYAANKTLGGDQGLEMVKNQLATIHYSDC